MDEIGVVTIFERHLKELRSGKTKLYTQSEDKKGRYSRNIFYTAVLNDLKSKRNFRILSKISWCNSKIGYKIFALIKRSI